jgi:hypothetical protein
LIIPLTGNELIDLDCNSIFWRFGVRFTFYNLCEQQARIGSLVAADLPAPLPSGYSYVKGVSVEILTNGQVIQELPDGTGIEMDIPFFNASPERFILLYWKDPDGDAGGEWLEVSEPLSRDQIASALNAESANELYKLATAASDRFYPGLTTQKTGIFVLVRK